MVTNKISHLGKYSTAEIIVVPPRCRDYSRYQENTSKCMTI